MSASPLRARAVRSRSGTPAEYAAADLSDAVATRWRGYVDRRDPGTGIQGWALVADAPLDPIHLELVVGDTPFHRVQTSIERADIDSLLGVRGTPGFVFPSSIFERLARLHARRREHRVRVRFAGTQVYLAGRDPDPTVGELVSAWCSAVLGSFNEPNPRLSKGDRLLTRLAMLRTEAETCVDQPLRPTNDSEVGQIDTFHRSADGLLWFSGWLLRDAEPEFLAVIVDRQKYPAGAAVVMYERQDLTSRHVAVLGIFDTGWGPPSLTNDIFIYIGSRARIPLRASATTQIIGHAAFLAIFREAQAARVGGDVDALGALLTSSKSWVAENAAAAGFAAEAALDKLLMIPGFGCIAEGWSLSPIKQVQTFQLKIGDSVLLADAGATYFRPRYDLAGIFSGGESGLPRAGFVTVFRGDVSAMAAGSPQLRTVFTDGSTSVRDIDHRLLRRLDFIVDSAVVLALYPSLRHETFYPALLKSIRRQLRQGGRPPRAVHVSPAQRVIVIRLPKEIANQRLCFDFLARVDAAAGADIGCCLIVDNGQGLTETKLLFQELRAATSLPLSLFCSQDEGPGMEFLPVILPQLLTDRFVYVGRGVLLTGNGWSEAIQFLWRGGHSINYFEFVDDTGAPDRINGVLAAACFGWTTAAFLSWLPASARLLRGTRSTRGLPEPRSTGQVLPNAAMRVEHPPYSQLADMIDDDLLKLAVGQFDTDA